MKRLLALLVLTFPLAIATPARAADSPLSSGTDKVMPSIVLILNDTSGSLKDNNGNLHGPYDLEFLGTGFFISSDGYIVTAAHVGAPTNPDIKGSLVDQYIDQTYNCDPESSADECANIDDQHHDDVMAQMTLLNPSFDDHVLTQDMSTSDAGLPATVAAFSPASDKDVAVLKVDGQNEPVALLGTNDDVHAGDAVAAIGYPASSEEGAVGPTLVPTVTTGSIVDNEQGNAQEPAANNADLWQFDAHIEHGNSGGPGVDSSGKIDGIVSFGDLSFNENYLVSVNDVRSVVAQTPAQNQLGPIDTLYQQGLDSLAAGNTTNAKQFFQQCAALNPVQVYCTQRALGLAPASAPLNIGSIGAAATLLPKLSRAVGPSPLLLFLLLGMGFVLIGAGTQFNSRRPPKPSYPEWPLPQTS